MAPASVLGVEGLCVDAVEALHAFRELFAVCLDDEVVAVPQEAEGVADPRVARDDAREESEEEATVVVVSVDANASGPPCGDVEDAVRLQLSRLPTHSLRR
jgi:site-specific DNA-cytosine methylase